MIDLEAPGTILFFGSMNAMPMIYARELRRLGQDVVYFVDVPAADTLSRPECHYADITYPYPDWIIEVALPSQLLASLFPRLTLAAMLRKARARRPIRQIKAIFLGGFFVAFAPVLPKAATKIFLSFGSDLDGWCNVDNVVPLARGMRRLSIFKFLPYPIVARLVRAIVQRNFAAAAQAQVLVYFPRGLSTVGDRLITRLEAAGVRYVPRYDVTFEHVSHLDRSFKPPGEKLVILSSVRFLYRTFSEGNEEYSKGNDIIIQGIAEYRKINPDIEVHFFEKGDDVHHAKALCEELGLADVVTWHQPLPFKEFLGRLVSCDIFIEQLGRHWMGTGIYALYLGKPVITNMTNLRFLGETPIFHAETPADVSACLAALADPAFRHAVSERSKIFAEQTFGPGAALSRLVDGRRGHE